MSPATLVDSNVVIDVLSEDSKWFDWSAAMLTQAGDSGLVVINPLIYAEISVAYDSVEELDHAVPPDYYIREPLPWEAAFLAAKAFVKYKKRGGTRRAPLPDFYIGAHAAIAGYTLLTRAPRRYRTYFPKLRMIAP